MTKRRYLGNVSIITIEYVALRDRVIAARNNGLSNLEIEGDSKVIINCYNKVYIVQLCH